MLAQQLRRLLYRFASYQDGAYIPAISSLRTIKKADRDLQKLKKALVGKEPLRSQSLYDEYHHTEVYKRIDTDLEAFFYKRQYTLENFNFLINLLGHQKKMAAIPQVLNKMNLLKITPDDKTYNYIIRAASHEGDAIAAEKYLEEAKQKFGESKYFYTSLMQVYVSKKDAEMAYKILQEMTEKGIYPDLPVYTSLINAFRLARKLEKCWELNRLVLKSKVDLDQAYVGVMLKVHAATHDAQKAVKLYQEAIIRKNIKPMLQTINSYFKALAGRPEYSIRVVDKFLDMVEQGEIINAETAAWALKACSTTANVKSAIEIIKIMKMKNIQPTVQTYNSLIRTYASACLVPSVTEQQREMMLTDTWKLVEQVINKNMLDTPLLNSVMLVYANALQQSKLQGLVLPLYQKFNLEMDSYSYEVLMDLQYKKKDFTTAIKVWQQMKIKLQDKKERYIASRGKYQTEIDALKEDLRPTFNAMETYLQIGIRLMDMKMVLDALEMFKKLNRHPKNSTLKFLGNLKNLPVQIQTSLMEFKIRFGAAKLAKTRSNSERSVPDPQNL